MLGQFDEAIAYWRKSAAVASDTLLMKRLQNAHGSSDYWSIRHELGSARLRKLEKSDQPASLLALMQASFASGNEATAMRAMEKAIAAETRALYRLSCMPDVDEFRLKPWFRAAVKKIGGLPRN